MNDIESEVPLSWWTRLTQALIRDPAITLLDTHDAEHDAEDMRRASSRSATRFLDSEKHCAPLRRKPRSHCVRRWRTGWGEGDLVLIQSGFQFREEKMAEVVRDSIVLQY